MLGGIRIPVNSTVTGHVSGATTDTADDVRCKVTLLGTVVLAVANTTTILTDLIFVIAQRTIKCGKFSELVAFVVILTFRGRCGLQVQRSMWARNRNNDDSQSR